MPSGEYPPHTDKPVIYWTEEDFVAWTRTVLRRDNQPVHLAEDILNRLFGKIMEERNCSRAEALEIYRQKVSVWQSRGVMSDGRHR